MEVCCIPLSEIAKCCTLFTRMLALSNNKYPACCISDSELLLKKSQAENQKAIKYKALRVAEEEFIDKSLPVHLHTVKNSYMSKEDYESLKTKQRLQFVCK